MNSSIIDQIISDINSFEAIRKSMYDLICNFENNYGKSSTLLVLINALKQIVGSGCESSADQSFIGKIINYFCEAAKLNDSRDNVKSQINSLKLLDNPNETAIYIHEEKLRNIESQIYALLNMINAILVPGKIDLVSDLTFLNISSNSLVELKPITIYHIEEVSILPTPIDSIPGSNKKSNEDIAREVIEGKWGNGEERKRRLAEAGYDAAAVQTIVNRMLSEKSNSNNGGGTTPNKKPGKALTTQLTSMINYAYDEIGKTDGTKYGTSGAWCAAFVTWCAKKSGALNNSSIVPSNSCTAFSNSFINNGQWRANGENPQAGDIVFFDNDVEAGPGHVGIVESVNGNIITVIHGNWSDKVCRTTLDISNGIGGNLGQGFGTLYGFGYF